MIVEQELTDNGWKNWDSFFDIVYVKRFDGIMAILTIRNGVGSLDFEDDECVIDSFENICSAEEVEDRVNDIARRYCNG